MKHERVTFGSDCKIKATFWISCLHKSLEEKKKEVVSPPLLWLCTGQNCRFTTETQWVLNSHEPVNVYQLSGQKYTLLSLSGLEKREFTAFLPSQEEMWCSSAIRATSCETEQERSNKLKRCCTKSPLPNPGRSLDTDAARDSCAWSKNNVCLPGGKGFCSQLKKVGRVPDSHLQNELTLSSQCNFAFVQ